jgi:hypothetical protein
VYHQLIFPFHQADGFKGMGDVHVFGTADDLAVQINIANGVQAFKHQQGALSFPWGIIKLAGIKHMAVFIFPHFQGVKAEIRVFD